MMLHVFGGYLSLFILNLLCNFDGSCIGRRLRCCCGCSKSKTVKRWKKRARECRLRMGRRIKKLLKKVVRIPCCRRPRKAHARLKKKKL